MKEQLTGSQGPKASTRCERYSGVSTKIASIDSPIDSNPGSFSRASTMTFVGLAKKEAFSSGVPFAALRITSTTRRTSGVMKR